MRFRATHDALTSLLNRGAIVELMTRELVRARREKGCTAVLLADFSPVMFNSRCRLTLNLTTSE
jgi:GGDEF domain-containing protein